MKLKKISAFLLASALFTACSDDSESWNSGNATVSMEQQEILVKENREIFNVPVVVTGDQSGPIQVTVEVAETGTNPAKEDVNYIVTSKTIIIPADQATGNIEICTVDDDVINDTRTFTVTISKVEGAQIGTGNSTQIGLRDNDSEFYEKLQGKWTMTTDQGDSWTVTIVGYEEDQDGYNETLFLTGMMGQSWTTLTIGYHYDTNTQEGGVEILLGELFAEGVSFAAPVGVCDVYTGTTSGNTMVFEGTIPGTWNESFTEVTFSSETLLWGFLAPTGTTDFNGYSWFNRKSGITLKR